MNATRMLVVWCPDWPVVAAGIPLVAPAAVLRGNRVVACTPAARLEGVALHQRRREAQARCPGLKVADDDPNRSARAFEPVVRALETLTPRIEVVRPGCCALPTRGPSRYHSGDQALAELAGSLVAAVLADGDPAAQVRVGVADGLFAATLAARCAGAVARSTEALTTPVPQSSVGEVPEAAATPEAIGASHPDPRQYGPHAAPVASTSLQ